MYRMHCEIHKGEQRGIPREPRASWGEGDGMHKASGLLDRERTIVSIVGIDARLHTLESSLFVYSAVDVLELCVLCLADHS